MVLDKVLWLFAFVTLVYCKAARQIEQDIQSVEAYIDSKKGDINQRYRLRYHIAAPVGWINDPNGFTYYKNEFHLFYQYYPYDSVWGPMHWGHVASRDLVHWKYLPTALVPEKEQCFSGSAVVDGDTMILMYTGHVNLDTEPWANETQYIAYSDDGITFHKYEGNPVISSAPNGSPDFRDPKAWKYGDHYYVVIGSKTDDKRGQVLLYRSTDMKNWEYLNVIAESKGDSYMYECPDLFELDGKFVLLMSPQGMEPQGDRYKNLHQTGYIIGSFSYDTFEFVPEVDFQEIDFGHDFYAAQTTEAYGARVLVAWFNMWEQPRPEAEDGWAGAMTLVRELRLVGDRLTMRPLDAMTLLRDEIEMVGILPPQQKLHLGKASELIVSGDLKEKIELQLEGSAGGEKAWLRWEPDTGKVVVDRGSGDIRQVEWSPSSTESWRIFLDVSSIELFCGEGEVVFSSRLFPEGEWIVTNTSPQILHATAYSLAWSVPL
ncbi:sucrose-6-phosphate hydrolase-like [Leguminivora glycinivorella]|uniref:sucrose-6-phosphate hydrolase-like n=1 Tax=Leguminivora glycinivorella TaxID=1035111 RepID=UPI002010375C|nr:sucrose-6-phosphate hydrolase-like [Leguminivora glycinivorella]